MLYILVGSAAAANIGTVYFLKASKGMTIPWASFAVVVSILLTQWIIAHLMWKGVAVAAALTMVVVAVMIGSAVVGFLFGERPSNIQLLGYGLAVTGVVVATLGKPIQ